MNNQKLTHWKKLENPDYIGSYAFQPNEKKTVTIKSVTRQIVKGPDGKQEECTVVHFIEPEKPLILNVCNGKMITKHADTPYIEQWTGVRIVLGVEKVKAFGEIVEAVRVLKDKPEQAAKAPVVIPPCADCGGAIEAAAGITADRIYARAMKRYEVPLCMACAMKRGEANKATEAGEVEAGEIEDTEDKEDAQNADNENQD